MLARLLSRSPTRKRASSTLPPPAAGTPSRLALDLRGRRGRGCGLALHLLQLAIEVLDLLLELADLQPLGGEVVRELGDGAVLLGEDLRAVPSVRVRRPRATSLISAWSVR
jgi:hypothetical protein